MQLLLQLFKGLSPFGNVVKGAGGAGKMAVGIGFDFGKHLDPAAFSPAGQQTEFFTATAYVPPGQRAKQGSPRRAVIGVEIVEAENAQAVRDLETGNVPPCRVEKHPAPDAIGAKDDFIQVVHHRAITLFALGNLRFHALAFGDVGTNGDVLRRQSIFVAEGDDGSVDPVKHPVSGAVTHLAMPYLARGNRFPHIAEQSGRILHRLDDTVVFANQLFARITADFTELVVGVEDGALRIGDADDGVLVEGELLVRQIAECRLQLALALLALPNQIGHQRRKRFQIVLVRCRVNGQRR